MFIENSKKHNLKKIMIHKIHQNIASGPNQSFINHESITINIQAQTHYINLIIQIIEINTRTIICYVMKEPTLLIPIDGIALSICMLCAKNAQLCRVRWTTALGVGRTPFLAFLATCLFFFFPEIKKIGEKFHFFEKPNQFWAIFPFCFPFKF